MKPPPRTRKTPKRMIRELEEEPRRVGKGACQWQRAEQHKLLRALKSLHKRADPHRDIDCSLLEPKLPTRQLAEICSVVEQLKEQVISSMAERLQKELRAERSVTTPIEKWTELAAAVTGSHEEAMATAFSQMLIVSSTEPCTLRNCHPPADSAGRPPTAGPQPSSTGKHPGTRRTLPLQIKTPPPTLIAEVLVPPAAARAGLGPLQYPLSTTPRPLITPPAPSPTPRPLITPPVCYTTLRPLITPPAPSPTPRPLITPPVCYTTLQPLITPPAPSPTPRPLITPPVCYTTLQPLITPPAPSPTPRPLTTPPVCYTTLRPLITPTAPSPTPRPLITPPVCYTTLRPLITQPASYTTPQPLITPPAPSPTPRPLITPPVCYTTLRPLITPPASYTTPRPHITLPTPSTTPRPLITPPAPSAIPRPLITPPAPSTIPRPLITPPPPSTTPRPLITPPAPSTTPRPLITPPASSSTPPTAAHQSSTEDLVGGKEMVDFERIYCFLGRIQEPGEFHLLTPMESAIVLDLLMSLPEELQLLDCNKLRQHLTQVYQCFSAPADSKTAKQTVGELRAGRAAPDSGSQQNPQPRDASSQSEDGMDVPPLNPFMVPLKLLQRREESVGGGSSLQ